MLIEEISWRLLSLNLLYIILNQSAFLVAFSIFGNPVQAEKATGS